MFPDYEDITSRIKEPPSFYEDNGVPRYGEFHPNMLGIYDQYAILVRIECQSCRKPFLVAHGWSIYDYIFLGYASDKIPSPEETVANYHYGDAPRHGCAGDTMNVYDIEVVQAWHQAPITTNKSGGLNLTDRWERVPDLEIELEDY